MEFNTDFRDMLLAFSVAKVDYLVVGAYAVAAHRGVISLYNQRPSNLFALDNSSRDYAHHAVTSPPALRSVFVARRTGIRRPADKPLILCRRTRLHRDH
jgi:hypothetical protein